MSAADALRGDLDQEEYLLTWNSHSTQLVQDLYKHCMENVFTDVTIATEDKSFALHKLVLSSCSPFFRSVLFKAACNKPVIVLKDVSGRHFGQLVKFMYLGQVSVPNKDLRDILKVAETLRIRGLYAESDSAKEEERLERPVPAKCEDDEDADSEAGRRMVVAPMQEAMSVDHMARMREAEAVDTLSKMPAVRASMAAGRPRSEHGSNGRKGYLPKRLRTSSERDSGPSPPNGSLSDPGFHPESASHTTGTESPHNNEVGSVGGASSEALGIVTEPEDLEEEEEGALHVDERHHDDEPVNFSQSAMKEEDSAAAMAAAAMHNKFSILSSFLRNGNGGGIQRRHSGDIAKTENTAAEIPLQSLMQEQYLKLLQGNTGLDNEKGPLSLHNNFQDQVSMDRLKQYLSGMHMHHGLSWPPYSASAAAASDELNGNANSHHHHHSDAILSKSPASLANGNGSLSSEIGPNGKPMVSCEVCGKKLADPSSLYRHRKIHSGEKPHQCPFCERRFIQRYNMKQHLRTHRVHTMNKDYIETLEPDLKDIIMSRYPEQIS